MSKSKLDMFTGIDHQQGAATLLVTVMLLIGVTLIALFATKVGILDQRISGNEYRHKEAFANAEAGLEQAAAYLRANPILHEGTTGWTPCSGGTVTVSFGISPCSVKVGASLVTPTLVYGTVAASTITPSAITISALAASSQSYLVKTGDTTVAVGVGTSGDQTGAAVAQIEYAKTSLLTSGEIPPLMTPTVDLSGNFTIVPDPNGGGPGVAVSAWVQSTTSANGSWQTCNHGEFEATGVCMDTLTDADAWKVCGCTVIKSDKDNIGDDIVVDPTLFPSSPFAYIFNNATQTDIKDMARAKNRVYPDCSTLESINLVGDPVVWIEGDCSFPSGSTTIIGNRTTPIVVVVEGDVHANGTLDVWGILLGLADFSLNGNTVIHGSAVSEIASNLTNGSYAQVYDESVFEALTNPTLTTDISKVKYSWRDFTP